MLAGLDGFTPLIVFTLINTKQDCCQHGGSVPTGCHEEEYICMYKPLAIGKVS